MADDPVITHWCFLDIDVTMCGRPIRQLHPFEDVAEFFLDVNCGTCLQRNATMLADAADECEGR